MIHNFKAQNFYSIGDEIMVDFESRSDASIKYPELYSATPLGKKVTRIGFVGGKNASGKTNVLRVLAFLQYLIVDSANSGPRAAIPFQSFIPMRGRSSTISVSFSIADDSVYEYSVNFTSQRILNERLERSYFKAQRKTAAMVFCRKWQEHTKKYECKISDNLNAIKNLIQAQDMLDFNSRSSFISLFYKLDEADGILRRIAESWDDVLSNIMQFGSAESERSLTQFSTIALGEMYENPKLREAISRILKKYDIGFASISRHEIPDLEQSQTVYDIQHIYGDEHYNIAMKMESNGTKRIIVLMRYILEALLRGGTAVIDELDAFVHPEIYDNIIEMFASANVNKRGAQLIFSAHNYTILNRLDKQQITLSDRNEKGSTETWRLDDMKGLRSDDNFYAKYLAGVYGGMPNISGEGL